MLFEELIEKLKTVKTVDDITDEVFGNLVDVTLLSGAVLLQSDDDDLSYEEALLRCAEVFSFNAKAVAENK